MFGSDRKRRDAVNIQTLIGAGTRVRGDIDFAGGCHVDGEVVGHLRAADGDVSTLCVSEGGRVEGSVSAARVVLNGMVQGDVHAAERVELGATARVVGNVHYRLIEMAIGAEVNGKLVHQIEQQALLQQPDTREALPAGAGTPGIGRAD
ncbi:MAG: polymer-forming cytoskeletal protein [Gammaproteobacteria bacterium]|nr:polymer-forming cytoskeletal protein [Gammaproteobacteria bacterium]